MPSYCFISEAEVRMPGLDVRLDEDEDPQGDQHCPPIVASKGQHCPPIVASKGQHYSLSSEYHHYSILIPSEGHHYSLASEGHHYLKKQHLSQKAIINHHALKGSISLLKARISL